MWEHAFISLTSLTRIHFHSDISAVIQLDGLWKKVAAHPRTCNPKQILLVSHFFSSLLKKKEKEICSISPPKVFVYSEMQKPLLVFCPTGQVILMAWNKVCDWLVMLLKFCTSSTPWYEQAEINLLLRTHLTFSVRGHVAFHFISHTGPAQIAHSAHKHQIITFASAVEGEVGGFSTDANVQIPIQKCTYRMRSYD